VFDMMYTVPSYHQAQTGIGVGISAIPETSDPAMLTSSGVRAWLVDYYRKNFGVFPIAIFEIGETTFVFRDPLAGDTKLNGRKIRSNASYEGIVRALGGAPVSMGPADAYAALQKGTLDGVVWPEIATAEFKLFEVTRYLARPTFGKSHNAVFMNAAKFDSLTAEQQAAIIQAGLDLEQQAVSFFAREAADQTRLMLENGVEYTEFSPDIASQLDRLYVEGQREIALRSQPAAVEALLELSDRNRK
jgi:TRAP-type C4-dicarboxylate transport system substrate-binding protein